ncbi:basic salivary proline-rich protein 3-like [Moschus berezovskii]|uniref:basic salivary proline-rich protein 3-like n=1 Tax=Moschus berezovskii TaxID=68408 RepID=UPI0024445469|nr:basic salivary proline-rich protein 3-like [Moschus berezovskii]
MSCLGSKPEGLLRGMNPKSPSQATVLPRRPKAASARPASGSRPGAAPGPRHRRPGGGRHAAGLCAAPQPLRPRESPGSGGGAALGAAARRRRRERRAPGGACGSRRPRRPGAAILRPGAEGGVSVCSPSAPLFLRARGWGKRQGRPGRAVDGESRAERHRAREAPSPPSPLAFARRGLSQPRPRAQPPARAEAPGAGLPLCRPVRTRQRRPPHGRVRGPQPCGGYPPAARPLILANAAAAVRAMD